MNWVNTDESCANTPPVATDAPGGRDTPLRAASTRVWTARVLLLVIAPVIIDARSPLLRLIVCGPLTFCIVARVERGTVPIAVGMRRLRRAAGVSAVPGGSWTRTLTGPEGSVAWAATCPLICWATRPANCCAESPD